MKPKKDKLSIPSNQDLRKLIRFEDESGCIWLGEQRMILLHTSAFGSMRSELVKSLGEEYARGVLMRMGYTSALSDVQLAQNLRSGEDVNDIFMVGPQLHGLEGVVSAKPLAVDIDVESGHFYGEFVWDNSFEAAEHLRLFGISDKPVCWQLLGYATGYTSSFLGSPIHFREVECVGKGDKQCRIIGKPLDEWDDVDDFEDVFSQPSVVKKLQELEEEVEDLRTVMDVYVQPENIIADSAPIKEIMYLLGKAAETDVTVLMLGETGVGKEVFSKALHNMGARQENPFIAVNCAALPRDLIESELFGVEKGGFTGADKSRSGRFERANGGTLFLDELGELSERAQAKLLRVIQTGELERVGGEKKIKVDVRIVAATNVDLEARVKEGTFRADLFYRLNVFPITIPPLRERYSDIPGLVNKFIKKFNKKHGKDVLGITDETLHRFYAYQWPGNIRELENILERGVILAEKHSRIESNHICMGMPESDASSMTVNKHGELKHAGEEGEVNAESMLSYILSQGMSFESLEKQLLQTALQETNGNVQQVARMLKITGPQCRYRMKKLGLCKEEDKPS